LFVIKANLTKIKIKIIGIIRNLFNNFNYLLKRQLTYIQFLLTISQIDKGIIIQLVNRWINYFILNIYIRYLKILKFEIFILIIYCNVALSLMKNKLITF
jgi:hypothetical protein